MYERFELCLKQQGLRPSDVSKATGISSSTLSEWKSGKHSPSAEKIAKIAGFLKVSIDFLMGRTDIQENFIDNAQLDNSTRQAISNNPTNSAVLEFKRQIYLEDANITDFEIAIILAYRKAPNGIQESVNKLLDLETIANTSSQPPKSIYPLQPQEELRAAHERTDIETTNAMKQHDYDIMKGDDF